MQFKAQDISNNNVITLEASKTLYDVRNILLKYNIGRVVILKESRKENKVPVGIITEKDIVRFLFTEFPKRRLDEIRADEVTKNQNLITAKEDTDLSTCAKLMLDNHISSLIITTYNDGSFILRSILTKSDLLDAYSKSYGGDVAINEYMTKRVLTVNPDESMHMVLLIMADGNVSRVIVVEDNSSKNNKTKPIGIITSHDLLPASTLLLADRTTPYTQVKQDWPRIKQGDLFSGGKSNLPWGMKRILLAQDIMTSNLVMITDYADLIDASLIMKGNKISGLPVVNSADNLVGIITKTDVTRAIADGR
jgi:CBS domain-containing protein